MGLNHDMSKDTVMCPRCGDKEAFVGEDEKHIECPNCGKVSEIIKGLKQKIRGLCLSNRNDEERVLELVDETKAEIKKPFNQIRPKDSWNMGYFAAKHEDLKALDSEE